jgi:hypothetical protein
MCHVSASELFKDMLKIQRKLCCVSARRLSIYNRYYNVKFWKNVFLSNFSNFLKSSNSKKKWPVSLENTKILTLPKSVKWKKSFVKA